MFQQLHDRSSACDARLSEQRVALVPHTKGRGTVWLKGMGKVVTSSQIARKRKGGYALRAPQFGKSWVLGCLYAGYRQ
jgi:hypothetical protein